MPGGKNFLMIISYIYIAPFIPWDPKHFINSMQKSKKIHHGNVAIICITLKISFSLKHFFQYQNTVDILYIRTKTKSEKILDYIVLRHRTI